MSSVASLYNGAAVLEVRRWGRLQCQY